MLKELERPWINITDCIVKNENQISRFGLWRGISPVYTIDPSMYTQNVKQTPVT